MAEWTMYSSSTPGRGLSRITGSARISISNDNRMLHVACGEKQCVTMVMIYGLDWQSSFSQEILDLEHVPLYNIL